MFFVIERYNPYSQNRNVVSTAIINSQQWAIVAIHDNDELSQLTPVGEDVPSSIYKHYASIDDARKFLYNLRKGVSL